MSGWTTELLRQYRAGRAIGTDDGFVWYVRPDDRPISESWILSERITARRVAGTGPYDFELTGEDGNAVRAAMFTGARGNADR